MQVDDLIRIAGEDEAIGNTLNTFLGYASHKIQEQAIPSIVDGLLPSQRRLLLAMRDLKNFPENKFLKSSFVGAHTTGYYAPIGSVYDVLVNMTQPQKNQLSLTQGEGTWGEPENLQAAAERYTEVRLSKFGFDVIMDELPKRQNSDEIPHGIVPQTETYNNLFFEERYLPTKLPLALINGSSGIAVGMAQTFQPLEIKSFLKEIISLLEFNEIDYHNLRYGHPNKCAVISTQDEFIDALKTGRGVIKVASGCEVEYDTKDRCTAIDITSIPPYTTYNKVGDLFKEFSKKQNCPFSNYKNESTSKETRLSFKFKKKDLPTTPEELNLRISELYKELNLTSSQVVNMTALDERYPKEYGLEEYITTWLQKRSTIIKNINQIKADNDLKRIKRALLRLFIHKNSEPVIIILRNQPSVELILSTLQSELADELRVFTLDDLALEDVEYLLDLKIHTITKMNETNLNSQFQKATKDYEYHFDLVKSPPSRKALIISEIKGFLDKLPEYGHVDCTCDFNENMREILSTKVSRLNIQAAKLQEEYGEHPFAQFMQQSDSLDIIVQTENNFFLRLNNKSVRQADFTPKFAIGTDTIRHASFINRKDLILITNSGSIVTLAKNKMEYNTPYHLNGILELCGVKNSSKIASAHIAPVTQDKPTHINVMYVGGEFKKVSLDKFPSIRTSIKSIGEILQVSLSKDEVTTIDEFGDVAVYDNDGIPESSPKRTGRLPIYEPESFGMMALKIKSIVIGVSKDKRSVYKKLL